MNVIIPFETSTAEAEDELIQCGVEQAIASARIAQRSWAVAPLAQRLKIIRRTRSLIANEAVLLAEAANGNRHRPIGEILSAEVLPLADACRFLERECKRILKTRRVGLRWRPLWLTGVASEVRREPHGIVLIIGASNYPLFLPAVQMLQALVAGNAVLLKPGIVGSVAADAFADVLRRAGTPPNLIQVLPESPTAAQSAIALGVDKVVFTGSATTGEAVLAQCAQALTPATVELSGCDAMFVRADAEIDLVVRAIQFGLRLNNGATCIAPRRVFVHRTLATELEERLRAAAFESSTIAHPKLLKCVTEALLDGADLIRGSIQPNERSVSVPLIVTSVEPSMRLARADIFAPVISLIPVASDDEALGLAAQCHYSLGATIFSRDEAAAKALATQVRAGVVVINDLIVPTADPRLPFGGRGRSGFGVTRGEEGLLEMTVPKVISKRRGRSHPHFDQPQTGDEKLFTNYIRAVHGQTWLNRLGAVLEICRAVKRRRSQ